MRNKNLGPIMMDIDGFQLASEDCEVLEHPQVGGFILFTRNFESKRQLVELIRNIKKVRPDILIAVDYEGGRVQRFREEFTRLPSMRQIGAIYNDNKEQSQQLSRECGWLIATELGEVGVDLCFAPVLDIDSCVSEVIGDRAFHQDPEIISRLAIAFMQGLAEGGMAATGKHFPGHGQVAPDSHVELPVDERTLAEINALDIRPFKALIDAGLASVMMAHIKFPAVDHRPASLSPVWIQQQLRKWLGFKGAVFCDDLSMGGAGAMGSYIDRAQMALEAGCDMLPVCNHRPGVEELLDRLQWQSTAESGNRLKSLKARAVKQDTPRLLQTQTNLSALLA